MKPDTDLNTVGSGRANRVGILLCIMTLCQYAVPAILFGALRLFFEVDTTAHSFGLPSGVFLCVYLPTYMLMMGIPLVLGTRILPRRQTALSPLNLSKDRKICVVLGGVALCTLANLLLSVLSRFGTRFGLPHPDPFTIGDGSVLTLLMDMVVFAVVPAVMEECLLRGMVLQAMRPLGNGISVLLSAIAFGLMHGSADQIPYAFLLGLVLGGVFVYTDDLRLTVLIHALANMLALISGFLSQFSSSQAATVWQIILLLLVMALGILSLLWLLRHPLERTPPVYTRRPLERLAIVLKAPFLWVAVGLMILLMILGNLRI